MTTNRIKLNHLTGLVLVFGLANVAGAQTNTQIASVEAPSAVLAKATETSSAASAGTVGGGTVSKATLPEWETTLHRWVDINEMDFSTRYRTVTDSNGAHEFNQGQQRAILDGRVKFDEAGKYALMFHASTGKYFNWAYADFIGGGNKQAYALEAAKMDPTQQYVFGEALELSPASVAASGNSGGWSFYVRRLYLDASPVSWLNVQYGSLDIDRGAASEITTYDNDGYIAGERITIKKPSLLFVDELSATWAYIGDLYTPNFFARGERLSQSNYHQFLMRKALWNKRVDASADYTWQYGAQTLRQAIAVRTPEAKFTDSVRFEAYQRINFIYFPDTTVAIDRANGWAVSFDKHLTKRGRIEYGYADIDPGYAEYTPEGIAAILGLASNGDAYGIGKRYYLRPTVNVTKSLAITGFYTHTFDTSTTAFAEYWNKQALNVGFVWDMKKEIFRDGK
jgi:hypothetical protein